MKFLELRPCDLCKGPLAGKVREGKFPTGNTIDFHRVELEHHLVNLGGVRQRVGLTMMLGGSEQLADVMDSNHQASFPMHRTELLICSSCWLEKFPCELLELGDRGRDLGIPSETLQELERKGWPIHQGVDPGAKD